jgi:hypothetical protein
VREAPGTTFKLADLLSRPVPRFKIISPLVEEVQRGGRAIIKISIEDTPDRVKAIRVQVNGREIGDVTPDIGSGGFGAGERMLIVPLARGKNEVRISLTNAIGEKAEVLTFNHEGEGALDKRGTLYILAIGAMKRRTVSVSSACFKVSMASRILAAVGSFLPPAALISRRFTTLSCSGPKRFSTASDDSAGISSGKAKVATFVAQIAAGVAEPRIFVDGRSRL